MKIIFDIGGTNTRVGISQDGKTIEQVETISTSQSYEEGIAAIVEIAKKLAGENSIEAICGGAPGLLNEEKTILARAWNLPDWENQPLVSDLQTKLGAIVKLENDTALGALGEANFGAGKNYKSVIYLSLGTGLGGAWVIDKKLVSGKFGFEPGHQIIDSANGTELETMVSGKSLVEKHGEALPNVSAEEIWADIEAPLSIGIYNSFIHWPSDIIVLGGGVIIKSKLSLEKLQNRLAELLRFYPTQPVLTLNELGDEAGLYGALTIEQ